MPEDHEQIVVRRKKLQALRERGIAPYPNDFRPDHTSAEVHGRCAALAEADLAAAGPVSIAGRIVELRDFGKADFLHLQDRGCHGGQTCHGMETKTPLSCTRRRNTRMFIAHGNALIMLPSLGINNETYKNPKVVARSVGMIKNRRVLRVGGLASEQNPESTM